MTSPARVRRDGSATTPLPRRSGGRSRRRRRTRTQLVGTQHGAVDRLCAVDDPPHLACLRVATAPFEELQAVEDPFFVEKVRDIVGLYLKSRRNGRWSCASTRRARSRPSTGPSRCCPCAPVRAERRSHDYKRHGTLSLFAALDTATGQVIGRCFARHRAREFRAFLNTVEARVPGRSRCAHNHGQPGDPQDQGDPRLVRPPPPMAGPLHADLGLLDHQVERFFALLTEKQLRRGVHRSTKELEAAILRYMDTVNADPKPFRWTKSADDILASIKRFCLANIRIAEHQQQITQTSESGH